jgi:hypothetical protein
MNLTDEMPPALDDSSASDVLRLHWQSEPVEPQYAQPVCCCLMNPPIEGATVINAGCQVHGLTSYGTLRSAGARVTYGLGR